MMNLLSWISRQSNSTQKAIHALDGTDKTDSSSESWPTPSGSHIRRLEQLEEGRLLSATETTSPKPMIDIVTQRRPSAHGIEPHPGSPPLNPTHPTATALTDSSSPIPSKPLLFSQYRDSCQMLLTEPPSLEGEEKIDQLLNHCRSYLPALNEYITPQQIITPKGLKLLLHTLKNRTIADKIEVFDNETSWGLRLQEIYNHPETFRGSFTLNVTGDHHLTHVHIEKSAEQFDLFFTDSMGYEPHYLSALTRQANQLMGNLPIRSFGYGYGAIPWVTRRQSDDTNCPVFSTLDGLVMCDDSDTLNYIRSHLHSLRKNINIDEFKTLRLPPVMMKYTQSISRLEHYLSSRTEIDEVNYPQDLAEISHIIETAPQRSKKDNISSKEVIERRNILISYMAVQYKGAILIELLKPHIS